MEAPKLHQMGSPSGPAGGYQLAKSGHYSAYHHHYHQQQQHHQHHQHHLQAAAGFEAIASFPLEPPTGKQFQMSNGLAHGHQPAGMLVAANPSNNPFHQQQSQQASGHIEQAWRSKADSTLGARNQAPANSYHEYLAPSDEMQLSGVYNGQSLASVASANGYYAPQVSQYAASQQQQQQHCNQPKWPHIALDASAGSYPSYPSYQYDAYGRAQHTSYQPASQRQFKTLACQQETLPSQHYGHSHRSYEQQHQQQQPCCADQQHFQGCNQQQQQQQQPLHHFEQHCHQTRQTPIGWPPFELAEPPSEQVSSTQVDSVKAEAEPLDGARSHKSPSQSQKISSANSERQARKPRPAESALFVPEHHGGERAAAKATSEPSSVTAKLIRTNRCPVCGRNYARPSTLKTHLRTHTNERPFRCDVCTKSFSQAANLTAHQRVHTGERPFSCPVCGRQFSQSSSVITHLRTHSGERPYRCNLCHRTFSDSSTLTKHCRIHSGEKPYRCDYCPLNFSQSGNLSRHLKLHFLAGGASQQQHQQQQQSQTSR